MTRPGTSEYASYYEGYVSQVPEGDILVVSQAKQEEEIVEEIPTIEVSVSANEEAPADVTTEES